jgi:hypothetical protein
LFKQNTKGKKMTHYIHLIGYSGCGKNYIQDQLVDLGIPKQKCILTERALRENELDYFSLNEKEKHFSFEKEKIMSLTVFNGFIYCSVVDQELSLVSLITTPESTLYNLTPLLICSEVETQNKHSIYILVSKNLTSQENIRIGRDILKENDKNIKFYYQLKKIVESLSLTNIEVFLITKEDGKYMSEAFFKEFKL